jgi:alkane 1-monooxygenase
LLSSPLFDWILYLGLPVHFAVLALFLGTIGSTDLSLWEFGGKVVAMGLMCAVFGINMAHELGHRENLAEQTMAKTFLLSSLYMHFFIEHTRGHHKWVGAPEDPASARYGETIYRFWVRSILDSYFSAWHLENKRLEKKGVSVYSLYNQMLRFHLLQLGLLLLIALVWGTGVMLAFVAAAFVGIMLLETVNYIEHYGLCRKAVAMGYERVQPWHSWNSDHQVGRILLFELSRHSDHHFKSTRKYQVLRHLEQSPQMPTGYPGMMLLALFPPLWFRIMHRRIERLQMAA